MWKLSENADLPKQLDSVSERLCVFVLHHASLFVENITNFLLLCGQPSDVPERERSSLFNLWGLQGWCLIVWCYCILVLQGQLKFIIAKWNSVTVVEMVETENVLQRFFFFLQPEMWRYKFAFHHSALLSGNVVNDPRKQISNVPRPNTHTQTDDKLTVCFCDKAGARTCANMLILL